MNHFARNIKYLMGKKKMTQQALADVIGKKRSIVGSYCRGERTPNIDVLRIIAKHFGVEVGKLISSDLEAQRNVMEEPRAPYGTPPSSNKTAELLAEENRQLRTRVTELLEKQVELQDQLIKCMNS